MQDGGRSYACAGRCSLFLFCKYGNIPVKLLKTAVMDFYIAGDISEAKVSLLDNIAKICKPTIDGEITSRASTP